jgi:TRAP-type C4-dicarboxylate transport system permease small subunit
LIARRTWLALADKAGRLLEDAVLVSILSSMILLAAGQILLRNVFDVGFIWTDELLRMLVLWIALAGAVAASRADKQINIAVLDRLLPDKLAAISKILVHAFAAAVCGMVTVVSVQFVRSSYTYGDVLLGQVPAWLLQLVLPLGFALITWRYSLFTVGGLLRMRSGKPSG